MKIIDTTISLPGWLVSSIAGCYIADNYPDSSCGNYASIAVYLPDEHRRLLWWTLRVKRAKVIAETINSDTVRIMADSWYEWHRPIEDAVRKYESRSGRNVVVKKVMERFHFSD